MKKALDSGAFFPLQNIQGRFNTFTFLNWHEAYLGKQPKGKLKRRGGAHPVSSQAVEINGPDVIFNPNFLLE